MSNDSEALSTTAPKSDASCSTSLHLSTSKHLRHEHSRRGPQHQQLMMHGIIFYAFLTSAAELAASAAIDAAASASATAASPTAWSAT